MATDEELKALGWHRGVNDENFMQGVRAFAQIMQKKGSRRCDPGRLELLYLLAASALRKQTGSNGYNAGYTRSRICQQKQPPIAKIDLAHLHFLVPAQPFYPPTQLSLV